MELEVTWKRAVRVWWSYIWRNVVAVILGLIVALIVGLILGLIMGLMGSSEQMITYVSNAFGLMIGLAISIIPIKLILNKSFGEFRLVLVRAEPEEANNEKLADSTS